MGNANCRCWNCFGKWEGVNAYSNRNKSNSCGIPPLTGITFYKGNIYVAHRGFSTIVRLDGSKKDIISGLPSLRDHHNNRVIFGPDGKMYFGQRTATNSGVVGEDNSRWVK